jgi:prepilin-type N-terminal cleavage/methylation domain-containing protein
MTTTRFRPPRAAFTLLEVLLVLSVLAVIIGISWPSVVRYMRDEAIREAAQSVQTAAAGSRIKAIDTGLTYQFRYEPGGQRFAVIPFDPPQNIDSTTAATAANPTQSIYPVLSGQIAESCWFESPDEGLVMSAPVERLPRDVFANLPDAYELESTAWGPPVLFYPDGTAIDAIFRIIDDGNRSIQVSVRGLTGTVSTGRLERERIR